MANYFSTRNANCSKKTELREALAALLHEEECAHEEYLRSVRNLITAKPGLTSTQYANMLSDNPEERNSIKTSIGVMAYMAEEARRDKKSEICECPSIPNLRRKVKTVTRRFVEIDANGNPLGTIECQEEHYTYHME